MTAEELKAFSVQQLLKRRALRDLLNDGKLAQASKIANELGEPLPRGQVVDLARARARR